MADVAIKLPKDRLIQGLSALPVRESKEIMDALIDKELFRPPSARAIHREAARTVKGKKLSDQVAEEAVRWARSRVRGRGCVTALQV